MVPEFVHRAACGKRGECGTYAEPDVMRYHSFYKNRRQPAVRRCPVLDRRHLEGITGFICHQTIGVPAKAGPLIYRVEPDAHSRPQGY